MLEKHGVAEPWVPAFAGKTEAICAGRDLDLDSFTNSEECERPKSVAIDRRELPMQTPSNPIARVCL